MLVGSGFHPHPTPLPEGEGENTLMGNAKGCPYMARHAAMRYSAPLKWGITSSANKLSCRMNSARGIPSA